MAWTTPYTYTPGETLSAAKLNTMEDNLTYLKAQTDLLFLTVRNNDAATINAGDPVALDPTYTSGIAVKMPTSTGDMRVFGFVKSASISSGANGIIAIGGTIETVNVTGTVVFGHSLVSSASAHYAQDSGGGGWAPGVLGFALSTNSGGAGTGTCTCLVKPYPLFYTAAQTIAHHYTNPRATLGSPAIQIASVVSDGNNRLLLTLIDNMAVINTGTFNSVGLTALQAGDATHSYFGYVKSDAITADLKANVATYDSSVLAVILNGVNQSTPVGTLCVANATSASVSVVVTCSPGDLCIAGFVCGAATVSGGRAAGQTVIDDIAAFERTNGRLVWDSAIATGSSFTFTWTLSGSVVWVAVGVAVKSA